jgi:hypothetical protein
MSRLLSAALAFVLTVAAVLGGFWLYGFDFNERGERALQAYLLSLLLGQFAAMLAAMFPRKGDDY